MKIEDRFLSYVAYPTMSDETSQTVPSTAKQLKLADALVAELTGLGLAAARDAFGYVYASLPANQPGEHPTVGFIAHMDTSDAVADAPIRPRIVAYEGGDIPLDAAGQIVLREAEYPVLRTLVGCHLIVTDGATLLGADDKAGIAEIITALERLIASGAPHGTLKIAFTPDEEIGCGADHFDVERFGADYAYTVDGGGLGSIECENFNAAAATVTVTGLSIHPGDAYGRMKNAALIACEFNALLAPDEIPSKTRGYEGFHHLTDMTGDVSRAEVHYILRDHDAGKLAAKKEAFRRAADTLNRQYGDGTVSLTIKDSYANMKEIIDAHPYTIERAESAMRRHGITPVLEPIRGGTDGARLSFMGLPCPNLCTGGYNFHSPLEFIPIEHMDAIAAFLETLMADTAVQ